MLVTLFLAGCGSGAGKPGTPLTRAGDEVVVCGQFFHTGAPVVLWMDPGGYDAYRVERRFVPATQADWERTRAAGLTLPNRYSLRDETLTPSQLELVRGGAWISLAESARL